MDGLVPLAQLMQFEFIIEADYWSLFLNKLAQSELLELRNIAEKLASESKTTIEAKYLPSSFGNSSTTTVETELCLIDIDHSMENKLIFYYLFQANIESIEKIASKIDLMTMEQKEKFIEQIFQKSPLQKLPKIIYNHPFCTIRASASPMDLLALVKCNKIKMLVKRPCFPAKIELPEEVSSAPQYSQILALIDEVKAFYTENQNNYILPIMLKQSVLMELDLQGLAELNKINGPLKEKIFSLINKEAPFTKGFINQ